MLPCQCAWRNFGVQHLSRPHCCVKAKALMYSHPVPLYSLYPPKLLMYGSRVKGHTVSASSYIWHACRLIRMFAPSYKSL